MNFYRESLNFPVFRTVGEDKNDPFNYKTPEEYLSLQDDVGDGKIAACFFYQVLLSCKEELDGDYELFLILSIMRAVGIKFQPDDRFGFVIKPIEGDGNWRTGEYNEFKGFLKKYQPQIIKTLAITGDVMKNN